MNDTGNSGNKNPDSPDLPLLVSKIGTAKTKTGNGVFWRIFSVLRFIPLVMIAVASIGVVALYFQPPGLQKLMQYLNLQPGAGTSSPIAVPINRQDASKQDEADATPKPIVGLGILVPKGDVTKIALPFGSADARIASIEVREGQQVEKGDLLARLDNEDTIRSQIENAKAAVAARQAQLEQTRNSVRSSVAETRAALRSANSNLENANAELTRAQSLFERGYTTNAVLEQRTTAANQAASEVERLKATLTRYESDTLDEQPDVKVAARNLQSAEADLARAQNDLSKALVRSPVSGTILNINARAGERPGSDGFMDIGDIEQMTADVEIYQTEIGSVEIGAKATLTAEALSSSLNGTVTRIGLEVGRQSLVDFKPGRQY